MSSNKAPEVKLSKQKLSGSFAPLEIPALEYAAQEMSTLPPELSTIKKLNDWLKKLGDCDCLDKTKLPKF